MGFIFFLFSLKYFLIFLVVPFLIRLLFRSILFNFQIFKDFPAIFLLSISNFIALWSENMNCMTWTLKKFLRLFVIAQNMTYLGKYSMCNWEGCILCCSININYVKLINSNVQVYYIVLYFTDFLSTFLSVIERRMLNLRI